MQPAAHCNHASLVAAALRHRRDKRMAADPTKNNNTNEAPRHRPLAARAKARRRGEGTLASAMTKTAKRIFLPTSIISAVAYVAFAPLAQLTHNVLGRKTAMLIGNSDLAKTVPGVLGYSSPW